MTETTTPEAPDAEAPIVLDDTTTQPEGREHEEAVTTTDEPQLKNDQSKEDPDGGIKTDPDKSAEEDLEAWAQTKGIDLNTPEGQKKALKSWREAEKAMHRKGQEKSELVQQLTEQPVVVDSDNELVKELAEEVVTMKRSQNVSSFVASVNLTAEQEKAMSDYLTENPQKIQLVNAGLLSLQEVYNLSGAGSPDPEVLKKQGGQEALQTLADKQRATAVRGAATKPSSSSDKDDPFLAGFNKE